ncbi:uncharacterized protein [Diadema setosum]|uniref:uncharacterized protein n=1 Tax=Diadema setosum TaxID=31175 RepID=UPI003B3A655C
MSLIGQNTYQGFEPAEKHQVFFLLPLLTVLMMYLCNALALEVYTFYEGRDVSLEFHQSLSIDSNFEYEVYLIDASCFFCRNGTMVSGCLTPQQSKRFFVYSKRTPTYLTVTLSIDTINFKDSQFYLLSLREDRNGESYFFTQDAYIEVLRPPSPARCIMKRTEYSPAWNEVKCTSLLGSDGEGSLYCFQNARKIPYKGTPVRLNDHVTWIFWMDALQPINCCSFEKTFPIRSESCFQFVYHPPAHVTNESENARNYSSCHSTTITADPETTGEKTFSQTFGAENSCATTTPHQAFTKNTSIALVLLFHLLFCDCLIM